MNTNTVSAPSPAGRKAAISQPPMWERDINHVRREDLEQSIAGAGAPEPIASITQVNAHGVPAWLYQPAQPGDGVLVWFHGGGWMLGEPACHDALARAVANEAGCSVLSVDYRRAPEHRYPVATDDAWTATVWASEMFPQVAVGGDSSGGNLAAAVAQRARDHALHLALQLLIYPVLDADPNAAYREEFAQRHEDPADPDALGIDWRNNLRYIWREYVPDQARRLTPDASPMHALSLAGLAPALLITAGRDILRAESEEYARRLTADDVPARVLNYPRANHGFFHLLATTPDARDAVTLSATALRNAFAGSPVES